MSQITDLMGLAKLANSKLVNKTYDDLLAEAMREGGQAFVDTVKALRLFTAPIQFLALGQERLTAFLQRARDKVPEERQQEAAPSIAGPVMIALRFMEDDNILTEMYINLLARAIDKERSNEDHPAYVKIIEQLSPDEALFLAKFKDMAAFAGKTEDAWWAGEHPTSQCHMYHTIMDDDYVLATPKELIITHIDHLLALGVLHWRLTGAVPSIAPFAKEGGKLGTECMQYHAVLSPFGKSFVRACIPGDCAVE